MSSSHPDEAVAFLDLMGRLPGSVGRFFSNHELNETIVKSGSTADAFESMKLLAQGDIPGALQKLGGAIGKLFSQEPHYEVGVGWGPAHKDIELPFGEDGLKAMGMLFTQFVDTLPEKVKTKVEKQIAKLAAKAGGSLVPGGSLVGLVGDAPDLVGALREEPKDWLGVALKGTKCALDIAGAFPGIGAITGPLGVVVGTVDILRSGAELISDVNEFRNGFAFG